MYLFSASSVLTFEATAVLGDAEQTCGHKFRQQSDISPQKQTEKTKLLPKRLFKLNLLSLN